MWPGSALAAGYQPWGHAAADTPGPGPVVSASLGIPLVSTVYSYL